MDIGVIMELFSYLDVLSVGDRFADIQITGLSDILTGH